jgi:hypothetical protein
MISRESMLAICPRSFPRSLSCSSSTKKSTDLLRLRRKLTRERPPKELSLIKRRNSSIKRRPLRNKPMISILNTKESLTNTSPTSSITKRFNFRNTKETICWSSKGISNGKRRRRATRKKERRSSRESFSKRRTNCWLFMPMRSMSATKSFFT